MFKEFDRDYYKPIRTNDGFAGKKIFIEYKSKGDRYENLSPKKYLNMIRPYLRDLTNEHKPIDKPIDESNENDDTDRAEWKIQLTMQNSCISTKSFEETCTIYTKCEALEIFMGSDTNDDIDRLFNMLLQRFERAQETSNDGGSEFIPDSVELLSFSKNRH